MPKPRQSRTRKPRTRRSSRPSGSPNAAAPNTRPIPHDDQQVAYTCIIFPSDKLTLAQLREMHPNDFDLELSEFLLPEVHHGSAAEAVSDILHYERLLARHAYETATGALSEEFRRLAGEDHPDYAAKTLQKLYTHYGLASSQRHARELIRDVQDQAAGQVI